VAFVEGSCDILTAPISVGATFMLRKVAATFRLGEFNSDDSRFFQSALGNGNRKEKCHSENHFGAVSREESSNFHSLFWGEVGKKCLSEGRACSEWFFVALPSKDSEHSPLKNLQISIFVAHFSHNLFFFPPYSVIFQCIKLKKDTLPVSDNRLLMNKLCSQKPPTLFPEVATTLPNIPTAIPNIPTTLHTVATTLPKVATNRPMIPTSLQIIPTTLPKVALNFPTFALRILIFALNRFAFALTQAIFGMLQALFRIFQAMNGHLQAIICKPQAMISQSQAISGRLQAVISQSQAISGRLQAMISQSQAIFSMSQAIFSMFQATFSNHQATNKLKVK